MNEKPRIPDGDLLTIETNVGFHESELPQASELDLAWLEAARADMKAALAGTQEVKKKPLTHGEIISLQILDNGQKNMNNRNGKLTEVNIVADHVRPDNVVDLFPRKPTQINSGANSELSKAA